MFKSAIVAFLSVAFVASAQAAPISVPPLDEAPADPTLVEFRDALVDAVENRDIDTVLADSCPDILLSFGGNGGLAEFREFLTVPEDLLSDEIKPQAQAMRDERWGALAEVLAMGGSLDDGSFWAPYTFTFELPEDYDAFETYVVIGTSVLVRKGPSQDDEVIRKIDHQLVHAGAYDPDAEYQSITLHDNIDGFIHKDFLRSPVDYRAQIAKQDDGSWKLCAFVAGD